MLNHFFSCRRYFTRSHHSLYCVIMLFALAQSSCYWQPVPAANLYASLTSPPSSAVTSSIPPSAIPSSSTPIDGMVHLLDRCWCDLGFGLSSSGLPNFFSPFDVSRWEARSLDRELRARLRAAEKAKEVEEGKTQGEQPQGDKATTFITAELSIPPSAPAYSSTPSSPLGAETNTITTVDGARPPPIAERTHRISLFTFILRRLLSKSKPNGPVLASAEGPEESHLEVGEASIAPPLPPNSLDLRPYGMGLVIDYGWGRSR